MPVPQNVRDAIAEELLQGASQGSLRRKYKVGAGTVSSIKDSLGQAGQTGLAVLSAPKGAAAHIALAREARIAFTKEERDAGTAALGRHILAHMPYMTRAGDIRQIAVAWAIFIDKARLEAGESSSIEEILIDDARADADPLEELRGRVVRLSERTRSG